jgi:hypothetical protein
MKIRNLLTTVAYPKNFSGLRVEIVPDQLNSYTHKNSQAFPAPGYCKTERMQIGKLILYFRPFRVIQYGSSLVAGVFH